MKADEIKEFLLKDSKTFQDVMLKAVKLKQQGETETVVNNAVAKIKVKFYGTRALARRAKASTFTFRPAVSLESYREDATPIVVKSYPSGSIGKGSFIIVDELKVGYQI